MINRGSITALTGTSLHRVFLERGKEYPLEYEGVLNVGKMPWNPITDQQVVGIGAMGAMPDGAMFPITEHIMGGTVAAEAVAWGQAVEFTKAAWRDEMYGAAQELVGEMSIAARWRKNAHAFGLIDDLFAGTNYTGFDGLAIVSASHTDPGAGTFANRPSPDVGFGQTGIQNAILNFANMRTPRGRPRLMAARQFLLSPQNTFAARELLGSGGKVATSNNELNSLQEDELTYKIVHHITNQAHWHLHSGPGQHDLWFLVRDDTEFDAFDDPWTGNAVFTAWQRHVPYAGSARGWYGSTG